MERYDLKKLNAEPPPAWYRAEEYAHAPECGCSCWQDGYTACEADQRALRRRERGNRHLALLRGLLVWACVAYTGWTVLQEALR